MIFEFYWCWYEDYEPHLFESDIKTEGDFENDCKNALKESFDKYLEQEHGWASLPRWIEFSIYKLEEYGYKRIRPYKFGYFGLYLPKNDDEEEEKEMPELKDEIIRMKKYNKEFDKELRNE